MDTKKILFTAAMVCCSAVMKAQTFSDQIFTNMTSKGNTLANSIINFVFFLIGVATVVELVVAYIKHAKGDPQSKEAMIGIFGGLALAFLILAILKGAVFNA